jgi:hypothetical protein
MAESTTLRISELLTERASHGSDELLSGAATSHTTSTTAITETTAPPALSAVWACRLTIALRSRLPTNAARAWPAIARPKTAVSETTTRAGSDSKNRSAISGPSCRPSSAPPKKPTNDSRPTRNPWR